MESFKFNVRFFKLPGSHQHGFSIQAQTIPRCRLGLGLGALSPRTRSLFNHTKDGKDRFFQRIFLLLTASSTAGEYEDPFLDLIGKLVDQFDPARVTRYRPACPKPLPNMQLAADI